MINGILSKHLADVENAANKRIDIIVKQLVKSKNINEDIKVTINLFGLKL